VQQPLAATQFLPRIGGPITTGFLFDTPVRAPVSVVASGKRVPGGRSKLVFTRCSSSSGTSRRPSKVASEVENGDLRAAYLLGRIETSI
jgi:hypothetical protein